MQIPNGMKIEYSQAQVTNDVVLIHVAYIKFSCT